MWINLMLQDFSKIVLWLWPLVNLCGLITPLRVVFLLS